MKKLLAVLLTLGLVFALAACGNGDSESSQTPSETVTASQEPVASDEGGATGDYGEFTTIEEGVLIMSTNAAFPPYEMTTDDGGYEGIDVEIAQAIADKLGLELQIDNMDFTAALEAAQSGMSDMVMAGVTVNEDRLAVMDFSESYATGIQVVIVKEGSDVTLDNLGEQIIGVQNGTTGWQYCTDDFGNDHVAAFDNGITAVQALMQDQVDCVVIDQGPAQVFVSENAGLTILDTEYTVEDYAIGVRKGNEGLLNAINTTLAELKADGTIQSIIDKYITAE
ncbi:MAG TPA: amino acid ABC transporter substrate-binding protein [Candidatus Enterenecus stercoripullorum]|nr:amino acid ABC transporter substrate-binding protein [Candidatus Enterenecus stercoripullorum]